MPILVAKKWNQSWGRFFFQEKFSWFPILLLSLNIQALTWSCTPARSIQPQPSLLTRHAARVRLIKSILRLTREHINEQIASKEKEKEKKKKSNRPCSCPSCRSICSVMVHPIVSLSSYAGEGPLSLLSYQVSCVINTVPSIATEDIAKDLLPRNGQTILSTSLITVVQVTSDRAMWFLTKTWKTCLMHGKILYNLTSGLKFRHDTKIACFLYENLYL